MPKPARATFASPPAGAASDATVAVAAPPHGRTGSRTSSPQPRVGARETGSCSRGDRGRAGRPAQGPAEGLLRAAYDAADSADHSSSAGADG
jgi:hypothetical protein